MLCRVFPKVTSHGKRWQISAIILIFCSCLAPCKVAAQVKPVRRVLIVYEIGLSSPSVSVLDQQIRAVLEDSPFQIELYREYLETTLFSDPKAQKEIREGYIHKYRDRPPDVVITLGSSPLRFLVNSHKTSFKGVPVLFGGLSGAPLKDVNLDSQFTGVWDRVEPTETLEVALRLQPDTKHVVVVGGMDAFDLELERWFHERLHSYESKLDFTYLTDMPMAELLERLRKLPPRTIVLLAHIGLDRAGTHFVGASQADPMIVKAANAPVYGPSDVDLGHGEVGGYLDSFALQGKTIGEMAVRILKGERPKDIPVVQGADVYMFDWQALKRWGLKESALPLGSIVINSQPTVWESYKAYIVGGISLIFVEALLILGLAWQRGRAKRAEAQLRESEGRFRLVANTAPVMIWMSGTDRKCSYVNKTWLDFTGRPLEAELGDDWAGGLHPDDSARCLRTYTEAFDRRESFEMQYRLGRHDGEYRWVLDKGVPRFNPDGTFAGFIGSCIDITERKVAEESLATMGRRLIEAQEEERAWIGRELHDDINQRLALLAVEIDRWKQHISSTPELSEQVRHAQERISQISKDVQGLSHRLHSSKLEYLGLATAANSFCKELSEQNKVEVQFRHAGVPRSLPKEVSLCLFRVLQEALQNALKHSGVRSFAVDLHGTADVIDLTVADVGRGFEEQEAFTRHGLGLISMRERLQLVQGELSVKSKPGAGTTIHARVSLKTNEYRAMAG
jgi:PAS domain S-box-containing protein